MTEENKRILDEIQKEQCQGRVVVSIPRDSRSNIPEGEAVLHVRYAPFTIKKQYNLAPVKTVADWIEVNAIYVNEEHSPEGKNPIEWFLMAREPVNSVEEAYKYVGYYMQRRKIERFHYVLKSGCGIEKAMALIMMYSIIAVMILKMTYTARLMPEAPYSVFLGEEGWKLRYCVANKEKQEPKKLYSMKGAVNYLGWLGGPSGGPPGVKTIWIGLMKLYILLAYRECLV
jgi:hypothetical protein